MPLLRENYVRQLNKINDETLLLGSMVEQAMLHALQSLLKQDVNAAKETYHQDILINEKRFAIENAILILIATQQPLARDLRLLASHLEISTELERMGDYAKGIAKVAVRLGESEIELPKEDLQTMGDQAVQMLHRALIAFMDEDIVAANNIPKEDDIVDELYNKIYCFTVDQMIANPNKADDANHIMWVAHNIERMADRVTNICERTVFIATGELMEIDISDDEDEDISE